MNFDSIVSKDKGLSEKITQSPLYNKDIKLWYNTTWIPIMIYSIPHACFTEVQLDEINTIILSAILPKLHINRKSPLTVLHDPVQLGGFGIDSFQDINVVTLTSTILKGFRTNIPWKNLLIISTRYLKLTIGTNQPPLQVRCQKYLSPSIWLCRIWKVFEGHIIIIIINKNNLINFKKQRFRYNYIIQEKHLRHYNYLQKNQINQCRMYLHLIYDSDICNISGKSLKLIIMNYIPNTSLYTWPKTPLP